MTRPELSRPLAADTIRRDGQTIDVVADPAERAALATRLGLPAVEALTCRFRLRPGPGATVDADGDLHASVIQVCVATLDEFPADISDRFAIRFVPVGEESDDSDPDAIDEVPYAAGTLDLGEAAAEQLALSLDPYPRKPDAPDLPDTPSDQGSHPFSTLRDLMADD